MLEQWYMIFKLIYHEREMNQLVLWMCLYYIYITHYFIISKNIEALISILLQLSFPITLFSISVTLPCLNKISTFCNNYLFFVITTVLIFNGYLKIFGKILKTKTEQHGILDHIITADLYWQAETISYCDRVLYCISVYA